MSDLNELAKAIEANTQAVRVLVAKASRPVVELDEKERLQAWIGELNKNTAAMQEAAKEVLVALPVSTDIEK